MTLPGTDLGLPGRALRGRRRGDADSPARVSACAHAFNPASARVLEGNGFVREVPMHRSDLNAGSVMGRRLMARCRAGAVPASLH